MRKWGIVVTAVYTAIVLVLLVPAAVILAVGGPPKNTTFAEFLQIYLQWAVWLPVAVLVAGEAVLIVLSVDTSHKRLKPRAHIAVSVAVTAMLFALLAFAFFVSLDAGIYGDRGFLSQAAPVGPVALWLCLWLLWAVVFYLYYRKTTAAVSRALSWLLKGSVLELLVAVPAHVWARRRDDCSAPFATSFGITTGIALMLLSFGPGIVLLYKKRLDAHPRPTLRAAETEHT